MSSHANPSASHSQPTTIKVISHTGLIYWWPVWLAGFLMAALTYAEGTRLAVVPEGSKVTPTVSGKTFEITVPGEPTKSLTKAVENTRKDQDPFPVHVAYSNNYGLIFVLVLLVVTFCSNVPFRGLASVIAILFLFLLAAVFSFFGWWDAIFEYLGGLHIQISVAGYLFPSVVLFILWLATFLLYDPLRYMIFTPGQLVLHKEIGDMRRVFDTTQVEVEKRRTDFFRHWILGFGAGDLIIKIPSEAMVIELPNVLFVGQRVNEIGNLMKTKPVVPQ